MKMKKCSCGVYTFKETCPKCGGKSANPNPPSFSPEDRFGYWRRKSIQISTTEKK